MSVAAIYKALAKEFSVSKEEVAYGYEALAAGLRPAYLAHFKRTEVGNLSEATLRRLDRRRRHFEDVDARRANVLKTIKDEDPTAEKQRRVIESCTERWQLDNLLVALRNPEPEVQLALDRGLGVLADTLVTPVAGSSEPEVAEKADQGADEQSPAAEAATEPTAEPARAADEGGAEEAGGSAAPAAGAQAAESESPADSDVESTPGEPVAAGEPAPDQPDAVAAEAANANAEASQPEAAPEEATDPGEAAAEREFTPHFAPTKVEFSAELARTCQPYVNPDRGLHTDEQVLEGAMRILSDRLGRDPKLRSTLRRLAIKNARISVRLLGDEKKLGRGRSLLKLNAPLSQIQGHRLLALRQALMQRQVALVVRLDPKLALPKVRAALGKHPQPAFASVLEAVAERAFWRRLVPFLEEEVKHELRERADDEALRFLGQSLRHVLLAPLYGRRPVAGIDVNPKGDWTLVVLDADGVPQGEELKLEPGSTELGKLAEALAAPLREHGVRAIALGNGKGAREATRKLRELIHLLGADAMVFPVNEAGLSSYANSEHARGELGQYSVPARMAIGLGRRLQDPLTELLKAEVRHLGLGREQSVLSKANLRRLTGETVESCVAFVGCDLNRAPLHLLRHVPGLDFEIASKIVERRATKPFDSREELRTEGFLDGVRWTNAAGFLLIGDSKEPLERATVHPDQYEDARALCAQAAASPEEAVGKPELFRKLKRPEHMSEHAWRDLSRALGRGGRDGRSRLYHPTLLAPDTDLATIEKGRIVEGLVASVTSFGVFVDLGVPKDGMIHISELSARYVRDAREMLSVGQVLRARVLDASGPRIELSLKDVPDERRERRPVRPPRGGGRARGERRDGRRREGGDRKQAWPEYQPVVRAASSRRDGLAGAGGGGGRGGRGGNRRGGGDRGGPRGGGGRRERDDVYDRDAVKRSKESAGSYNPFATFFKDRREEATE